MPLTNLNFLNKGQQWPPQSEVNRIEMYETNKQLFNGDHVKVYREAFKRIERVINNFSSVISYPIVINFQRLIAVKIADLLLGEKPTIQAGEDKTAEQTAVDKIIENTDLYNTLYEAAIDVPRFGDAILYVYQDINEMTGEIQGCIDVTQPGYWFPVVANDNLKKILFHVIAWLEDRQIGQQQRRVLVVRIHSRGKIEKREYLTDYGFNEIKKAGDKTTRLTIQDPILVEEIKTGLNDFAIIQIPNLMTSDRVYGYDDFTNIDSIISELLVRIAQIGRILDKHADPSVSAPVSVAEKDPNTGEWKLRMGNAFLFDDPEAGEVKYVTWDASLDSAFTQIEKLINFLYTVSEMGSAIFGDLLNKTGEVPSGTALRRLMMSALAKVNRIRMRFDPAVKKALKLCSILGGKDIVSLENAKIAITWQDGLPADAKEDADIAATRTGGAQTMSTKDALMFLDGLSDEEADEKLQEIMDEKEANNPFTGINDPFADLNNNKQDEGGGGNNNNPKNKKGNMKDLGGNKGE